MIFFKKKYKTTVYIDGMSCSHCAAKVENTLNAVKGCSAKVDLDKKCAYVKSVSPLNETDIFNAIFNIGFTPVKIEK